ncbi:DUF1338 domain protein [Aspergillus bertholletiae]|uniref:2-oxoadipate dioxygenase/decarboxylase n=1 Tax=Aspergillus bertholletiae TaxID=1226010 RepID=A0A5N7BPN3_9EURO|nr:DUF1338 domain protein [Aspergillus bertholletiae]
MEPRLWDASELRTKFSNALSDLYRAEVPLYASLIDIVKEVDSDVLKDQGKTLDDLPLRNQLERHGAIRLATDHEMQMIKRLFAILGMYPVGYYDRTVVSFPLHGTEFRPISATALQQNPFRVFTTVLRRDLIVPDILEAVDRALGRRNLFTPRLCEIIDSAEKDGTMAPQEADDFISEAFTIFKWHSRSTVSLEGYLKLKQEHPVIADIVCFPSAHINHLTPRTLDIDRVQRKMIQNNLPAKAYIEGPPLRSCPILLRQTSFTALAEAVEFVHPNGQSIRGTHTARFGEIEQRGAALTTKGRDLNDQLHASVIQNSTNIFRSALSTAMSHAFRRFPDSWEELRVQNLVFFRYAVVQPRKKLATEESIISPRVAISHLLSLGLIRYEPITYEELSSVICRGDLQIKSSG